jgi:hypothetical protein
VTVDDPQAYVQQVMAEIAEEVRLRRASGDLPPKLERELDELFLAHAPVGGRGSDPGEALRAVDTMVFIDPVVPVESNRAGGAVVKKSMLGHAPDEPVDLGGEQGAARLGRPPHGDRR